MNTKKARKDKCINRGRILLLRWQIGPLFRVNDAYTNQAHQFRDRNTRRLNNNLYFSHAFPNVYASENIYGLNYGSNFKRFFVYQYE